MSCGWSKLHKAVILFDSKDPSEKPTALAKIRAMARRRGALQARTSRNNTALHLACSQNDASLAQAFLSLAADVAAVNSSLETPLHHAVAHGNCAIISLIVSAGADVNAKDKAGCTPLHWAFQCEYVQMDTLEILIKAGCDQTETDANKETALHYAAREGHLEAFNALLDAGADLSARNKDGLTPFHNACLVGQVAIVQAVLARPGSEDAIAPTRGHNLTALHFAARNSSSSVWDVLFPAFLKDLEAKDIFGRTPLAVALTSGNTYAAERLGCAQTKAHEPNAKRQIAA